MSVIDLYWLVTVFQTAAMTGAAYGHGQYHDDELDYLEVGQGDYSSDSDNGNMLSGGEETDDASETESYNHQVIMTPG